MLAAVADRAAQAGLVTAHFGWQDFTAEDLLLARFGAPQITVLAHAVRAARGLVLATPVYKAVYSGLLKLIVDLIPQDALRGKVALGLATATLGGHEATVDHAYAELFRFFRVGTALPTLYLLDADVDVEDDPSGFGPSALVRIDAAADALISAARAAG